MSPDPAVSAVGGASGRPEASLWQRIRARFRRKELSPEECLALWERQKFNEALAEQRQRAIESLIGFRNLF
jgi:hypothetical protein